MSQQLTWGQYYDYLYEKLDFKEDANGKVTWVCNGDLQFSEQFCKENKVNWGMVKQILENHGGYCDCEVLFNVEEFIGREMCMPQFDLKTGDPL